jgi:hypothetical protein
MHLESLIKWIQEMKRVSSKTSDSKNPYISTKNKEAMDYLASRLVEVRGIERSTKRNFS